MNTALEGYRKEESKGGLFSSPVKGEDLNSKEALVSVLKEGITDNEMRKVFC